MACTERVIVGSPCSNILFGQRLYVNEVKRGYCCTDGYHLGQDYNGSKTDPSLLCLVALFSCDEAVDRMKNMLLKQRTSVPEANDTNFLSEEQGSLSISGDNDDDQQISVSSPSHVVIGNF
ncbi:unnamed protein product [Rotaria sp. Silwood2]|nr:unnamed protein product [Rotaria sp. Silwood2]CAF2465159.1 unnamed protein product [Rotaria sp. Silwood2]CAF2854401.1 unnamed protein product [Rotaria sp. Silwood2]CAF3327166.1 unnamed protein product [Rotaria sp. Silwood2]CAF3949999.1 unnamed protein product [Rotaria sp. Silwood2]